MLSVVVGTVCALRSNADNSPIRRFAKRLVFTKLIVYLRLLRTFERTFYTHFSKLSRLYVVPGNGRPVTLFRAENSRLWRNNRPSFWGDRRVINDTTSKRANTIKRPWRGTSKNYVALVHRRDAIGIRPGANMAR